MSSSKQFKTYSQHQTSLFPTDLSTLIPEDHPVRTLNLIIDQLDLTELFKEYSDRGASNFHPRMMLKVWVYGYLNNIYSSRKLENSLKENIYMMWLSGMQRPDHNTLSRFRSGKLKPHIKTIFFRIVRFLIAEDQVDLSVTFTDGTKVESKANKYTFVWGKRIKKAKENIEKRIEELWDYAEKQSAEELKDQRPSSFKPVSTEQVKNIAQQIGEALKDKPVSKKVKQQLNYLEKKQAEKVDEYNEQEEILNGRNSYSKTDPDSTFMRMKDDPMKNGQLKPAYNIQASTQQEYIMNYSLHQTAGDSTTFKEHYDQIKEGLGEYPAIAVADAGYGSEENYEYLKANDIENVVKYPGFHKEQRTKNKNSDFSTSNLYYNQEGNYLICPMGQKMDCIGTRENRTSTGFSQTLHIYRAKNCHECPLRPRCFHSKYKHKRREVALNLNLMNLRKKARENLTSTDGEKLRKQRCAEVEQMFGQMKANKKFTRFLMAGMDKVSVELGLLFSAMNIMKYSRKLQKEAREAFLHLFFSLFVFRCSKKAI